MQIVRADTRARCRRPGNAVAGGDKRIRAVVDIEQRTLRALEQEVVAGGLRLVQEPRHIRHHRPDALGKSQRFLERLAKIDRRRLEVVFEHEVVQVEDLAQLRCKPLAIEEILQTDRTSRDFVLIGGPDAATGRADLAGALCRLARLIERDVVRQNEGTGFADLQS